MKQAEKIYMISDAAKKVEVEAHVLRYWEEELEIPAKYQQIQKSKRAERAGPSA